jgi:hypothetical protein
MTPVALLSWSLLAPEPTDRTPSTDVPVEVVAPADVAAPTPVSTAAPIASAPAPEPAAVVTKDAGDPNDITKARLVRGKGIEWKSRDERFMLQLRARVQVRYDFEHPNVEGENNEQVLQIRRARLQLQGHIFGKHNRYYLQFGFSPRDQTNGLIADEGSIRRNPVRDARLEFDYLRDFTLWIGQMKVPFSRQRVNSSGDQNMVDRSLPNDEFQLDRDIGIQALSKDVGGKGLLTYNAGVFMGEGRNAFELTDLGMLYVARIAVLPFGKFEDDYEGDLERSKTPGLSIAGAYVFHDRAIGDRGVHGSRPADGGTTDIHNVTADVLFKWRGVSLTSAFHWRRGFNRRNGGALDDDGNTIATEAPRNGLGWFGQLGYVVPRIPFEVVARYGFARARGPGETSLPWRDEAGAGINYYFVGHSLKLQLDYFRVFGETTGTGYVDAARHGTDQLRMQMQLAF